MNIMEKITDAYEKYTGRELEARLTLIADRINKSIKTETKFISPDDARKMLKNSVKFQNRKLDRNKVKEYRNYILEGKWVTSLTPLIIDVYGSVLNGQHRLNAIIEADVGIIETVKQGNIPSAMYNYVDTNRQRKLHHSLGREEVLHSEECAKVVRLINCNHKISNSGKDGDYKYGISIIDGIALYYANADAINYSVNAVIGNPIFSNIKGNLAYVHWVISKQRDKETADKFIKILRTMEDPITKALYETIYELRDGIRNYTGRYIRLLFSAWNHYATNEVPTNNILGECTIPV